MLQSFRFEPLELPPEMAELRGEVREFMAETLPHYPAVKKAESWTGFDPEFSRQLGARGWIGMRFPKAYGGHERSALERYVVLEELLAAGAPVAAHWIADRQSGPLLLRYGNEEQKKTILSAIARGECYFCIGMSEPDSGSDLASIRTRADRRNGSWVVNGRKVWTSNAHRCQYMIALFRTDQNAESKHDGLSQFLVDTKTPGITIRPIKDLSGDEHFNEVTFDDVELSEDALVGTEGEGWRQVVEELAFERSGPERYMSSYQLIAELVREVSQDPGEAEAVAVGRMVAHLASLRQMSLSVAGKLEAGIDPALEGSVVKDLGTAFEQWIPQLAHETVGVEATKDGGTDFHHVMSHITQVSPSFSLRGGTREVLRGIIARGLGLR